MQTFSFSSTVLVHMWSKEKNTSVKSVIKTVNTTESYRRNFSVLNIKKIDLPFYRKWSSRHQIFVLKLPKFGCHWKVYWSGLAIHQSEFEANTCNRHQRRQNACKHGFASHWERKWREFCQPITERSNAKPKQTRITCIFDTVESSSSEGTKKGICHLV